METLAWGWPTMPRSMIFEKMMDLALPIVKHYRSDLFHDALWLKAIPDKSIVFYYTVRETGTWISTTDDGLNRGDATYRITVTRAANDNWEYGAEKIR